MSLSCPVSEILSLIPQNLEKLEVTWPWTHHIRIVLPPRTFPWTVSSELLGFWFYFSPYFYGACTIVSLLCIDQHTIFEVPSFADFKDIIGGQKLKNGSLPLTTPIRGYVVTEMDMGWVNSILADGIPECGLGWVHLLSSWVGLV